MAPCMYMLHRTHVAAIQVYIYSPLEYDRSFRLFVSLPDDP